MPLCDLHRRLDDLPTGAFRDRIAAKHALVSHLLQQLSKGSDRIHPLHEPEVDCISSGKAWVRSETGCKLSIATTLAEGFAVGNPGLPGNPSDGHTLELDHLEILSDHCHELAVVDHGCRCHLVGKMEISHSLLTTKCRR